MTSVLTPVAENVATKRYYHKDDDGNPIEDWEGLSRRVVNYVCKDETDYFKKKAFDLIYSTKFLPNSPCLVNAGRVGKSKGLLACFVTKSPEDSWLGMIENIGNFGHIARQGGGCGVSFSNIRPEGDSVFGSTHAKACGPIEHMRMISEVMSSITQSGFRGMAMMGTLNVSHPDVMRFIVCKQRDRALRTLLKEDIFGHYDILRDRTHDHLNIVLDKFISNFNISVVVNNDFMKAVEEDLDWDLTFNGKTYTTLKARAIFDAIVENAWRNGDPGMLFHDAMNSGPYKYSGQVINATNPCGEQVLPDWGSCNLGSIDVSKFYDPETKDVDWDEFKKAIRTAIQFLDDVIDANTFPTPDFAKWAKDNRPVGLGLMGFADLLLKMKLAYGSKESLEFADKLMSFMAAEAHKKSVELGRDRGTPKSCRYEELEHRRNVTTLSVAPTGSIALLAGCYHSIEPAYSETIHRYDNTGEHKMGTHPDADKPYFKCAVSENSEKQVTWEQHIDMQSAFQRHCDSAISKTINMCNDATKEDIYQAYIRAWKSGCKGITIYRDGSKTTQVLLKDEKQGFHQAVERPKEVECDIFKTKADGFDWHVIVGKVDRRPYELFAVNGKVDLPKEGKVVKKKRRHYTLVDDQGETIIDNIAEAEDAISPRISLETRRFSLELRNQIHPRDIVEQIDKSSETLVSFSKAVSRIMRKHYLTDDDHIAIAEDIACPACAKKGERIEMQPGAGCWECPKCRYAVCG